MRSFSLEPAQSGWLEPWLEKKPAPPQPATSTILPMQLQVGDRFVDETEDSGLITEWKRRRG